MRYLEDRPVDGNRRPRRRAAGGDEDGHAPEKSRNQDVGTTHRQSSESATSYQRSAYREGFLEADAAAFAPTQPLLLDSPGAMGYEIEVGTRSGRVVDFGGQGRDLELFVHKSGFEGHVFHNIALRLNDPQAAFVPCQAEGSVHLVNLDWVAYIDFKEKLQELKDLLDTGAYRATVQCDLVTGETLIGDFLYEAPIQSPRVSDLVNSSTDRFLLMEIEGGTRFINRRAILEIRS